MRAQIERIMMRAAMKKALVLLTGLVITSVFASACGDLTGPTSPETPTNVTAKLGTGNRVTVSWTPSPQSDGVVNAGIDTTINAATNNATRMESLRPATTPDRRRRDFESIR